MTDSQLVYRRPCEHGEKWGCGVEWCPGGSETVLDPDRKLPFVWRDNGFVDAATTADVADVLAWLDGEEE